MVTEAQRDQAERRATLDNDRRVREQTGTYMSHTHDDAFGRWREHSAAFVVGSTPVPNYPAAGAHQADPCGTEPPLSFDNPALERPTLSPSAVQAGEPMSDVRAPLRMPGKVRADDVGSPLSSPDMAAQCMSRMASAPSMVADVRTERPPT